MWIDELFGVKKPIIAMLHLRALPGDPLYEGDMGSVIAQARKDLVLLQDGGVDGVLIANEFSMPYSTHAEYVTIGAMGFIVGQLHSDIKIPFGVNVVLNALASLELAAATGASFIRSAFTGAYMGEQGLFDTDAAATVRRKQALKLDGLKLLYKVNPESDVYLVPRNIKAIAKSIIFSCVPDGLCVSGSGAGDETNSDILAEVKEVAGSIPVFCNTGFSAETAREKFAVCDAACVGTAFKEDGKFVNNVDLKRVEEIMNVVREIRRAL
ncbi:MAG: BtpA/SgcQ family protein [Synergistaceae bacterium]|nr:BtpA/SgcQ family protein [Synergistaceae bacterium]